MILDYENMFSQNQAVTATAFGANIVDLGPGDIGPSEGLSLFVNAGTPYGGTGSLVVEVTTSDEVNAAGTALSGPVTLATFPVSNAALVAGGKLVSDRLPHGMKRYMRVHYTVSGTLTDGALTAGLTPDSQSNNVTMQ